MDGKLEDQNQINSELVHLYMKKIMVSLKSYHQFQQIIILT